jgi:beta-glucosidase
MFSKPGEEESGMRRVGVLAAAIVALATWAPVAAAQGAAQPSMNRGPSPDQRADELAAQMTQPEKVNLVTGTSLCGGGADGYVAGDPRLPLPALNLVGAGAGVTDICHRASDGAATELPAPIAMAASWDPQIAYVDGALIGLETRALGFDVAIGGDVNLARDPRNGRTFEAEGEDPLLAGTIVGAQLRGTQSQHIPATIKHFAFNNEEQYRGTQSSDVDQRTMRELELRAFQIGIQKGDPAAVMCSYNLVNGTPACENSFLLNTVLKQQWGFKGWVMSDWWACDPPVTTDSSEFCQTAQAANAGLDQEQPNAAYFGPQLLAAIANGAVPQARLDDMVHRILRSLFASGVIDRPPVQQPIDVAHGATVAQEAEERSAVLLKNAHSLLPLSRAASRSVAVIGAPADAAPPEAAAGLTSSAYVDPIDPDTPLAGLQDVDPEAAIHYNDGSNLSSAAALARSSQIAIVYAKDTEEEGTIRPSLSLDPGSDSLIEAVAAANPRTVVVLMSGSAVTMPWIHQVPAVLEGWYPGERGGHAIAHLLFGDANPSGRLPITFPGSESGMPTAGSSTEWPGDQNNIRYNEGLLLGYRWYDAKHIAPLFPFGYGLTYGGRFKYSSLRLTPSRLGSSPPATDDRVAGRLTFKVSNVGTRAATEVPQVYLGFPSGTGEPPRRLVGWSDVVLRPHHSKRISIAITGGSFALWDTARNGWTIPNGKYSIWVGASSRDLRLRRQLEIGRKPKAR